jgi:hypothetical protein
MFIKVLTTDTQNIGEEQVANERQRPESNIPSFQIQYLSPYATFTIEKLPHPANGFLGMKELKEAKNLKMLKAKSYSFRFAAPDAFRATVGLGGIGAQGAQEAQEDESYVVIAPNSMVEATSFRLNKNINTVDLPTEFRGFEALEEEYTFKNDDQALTVINEQLQLLDTLQAINAATEPFNELPPPPRPPPPKHNVSSYATSSASGHAIEAFLSIGVDLRDYSEEAAAHRAFNLLRIDDYIDLQLPSNTSKHQAVLAKFNGMKADIEKRMAQQRDKTKQTLMYVERQSSIRRTFGKDIPWESLTEKQKKQIEEKPSAHEAFITAELTEAIAQGDAEDVAILLQGDMQVCQHLIAQGKALIEDKPFDNTPFGETNDYVVYCKYCGQALEELDRTEFSFANEHEYSVFEDTELEQSIRNELHKTLAQFVQFKQSLQQQDVLPWMAQALYPVIQEIHLGISRIKGTSNDILDTYICMYALAICVRLASIFPNSIALRQHAIDGGLRGLRGSRAPPPKGKKPDKLKELLISAAKILVKYKGQEIAASDVLTQGNVHVAFNKAYNWAFTLDYSPPPPRTPFVDPLIKLKNLKLKSPAKAENLKMIMEAQNVVDEFTAPESERVASFYRKFQNLRVQQWEGFLRSKRDRSKPVHTKEYGHDPFDYAAEFAKNKGKCHCGVASKTLLMNDGKRTVELPKDHIVKALESGDRAGVKEFYKKKLVGFKCECEQRLPFYTVFASMCPVEGLHEFKENKCIKCGITPELIERNDAAFANKHDEAFRKFNKKHEHIQLPIATEGDTKRAELVVKEVFERAKKTEKASRAQGQEIDNNAVMTMCKALDLSPHLVLNIGLYEGQVFKAVSSGQKKSSHEPSESRNHKIASYIYFTKRTYNFVRHIEVYTGKMPAMYAALFNDAAVKGFAQLPEIPFEFSSEAIDVHLNALDVAQAGASLISMLASLVTFAMNAVEKTQSTGFAKNLGLLIMNRIRDTEHILSFFELKHIKGSTTSARENDDEGDRNYEGFSEDEDGDDDDRDEISAESAATQKDDAMEAAPSMKDLDFDEDIDEDHFEKDLAD